MNSSLLPTSALRRQAVLPAQTSSSPITTYGGRRGPLLAGKRSGRTASGKGALAIQSIRVLFDC